MIPTACATLLASLKAATAGAVLALPAGPCAMPTISNVNPPGVVTITSQDPTHPAILTGDFKVANSSNLTFSRLIIDFSTTDDPYWPGRVSSVKNLTLDQVEVRSSGPTVEWPGGFNVVDSDHFAVTNSKLHDVPSVLINVARTSNITISGNDFYRWGKSAIGASAVQELTVSNNNIHDSFPPPGTHSDGLQIFTAGTKTPSSGIVVTNNHLWTGDGYPFQGIFIQDETDVLPISNVTVSGNQLSGTMWDSIWLRGVAGANKVVNNTMVSWRQVDIGSTKDLAKPVTTDFTANLETWVVKGGTLTVAGNSAQAFSDSNGRYVDGLPGNTKLGPRSPPKKPR
jgi:hypothetical protein